MNEQTGDLPASSMDSVHEVVLDCMNPRTMKILAVELPFRDGQATRFLEGASI